jgi:hypothetical protein
MDIISEVFLGPAKSDGILLFGGDKNNLVLS